MTRRRTNIVILALSLALTLAGCPVTLNMMLKNETETDLSVSYATGHTSQIGPGDVKKVRYNLDCITVVSDGVTHNFRADWPLSTFVKSGTFSSTVDAVFTKDRQLVLTQAGDQTATHELEKGCG